MEGGRLERASAGAARRRKRPRRFIVPCLFACAAFLISAGPSLARKNQPRTKISVKKALGLVTEIHSSQIVLMTSTGSSLTLETTHDWSPDLVKGEQITAWYSVARGAKVVTRIEPPLNEFLVPPGEFLGNIHKAILLPHSGVEGGGALFDQMTSYLRTHFNWYLPPPDLAKEIRRTMEQQSVLDAMNPQTGAFDIAKYAPSHADVIRRIAANARVDAVVEVWIEKVPVQYNSERGDVQWDGVKQAVGSKMGRVLDRFAVTYVKADVPATTVVVKLWSSEGKPLWVGRRGLFLLAENTGALGGRLEPRPLSYALANHAAVTRRLARLFGALAAGGWNGR